MSRCFFCASWFGLCSLPADGTTSASRRRGAKTSNRAMALPFFLGAAELAAGLGVMLGVLTQLAAIGLILIMLAAIWKRFSSGVPASGANRERMAGATALASHRCVIRCVGSASRQHRRRPRRSRSGKTYGYRSRPGRRIPPAPGQRDD